MALDRRRFLQLSALGVAASLTDAACSAKNDRPLDQPALIAVLGPERVRALGARYRVQTPGENTADALRAKLSDASRSGLFHKSVDDAIADDFENNRTVLVDGWVLAVTEARQAALFSLSRA